MLAIVLAALAVPLLLAPAEAELDTAPLDDLDPAFEAKRLNALTIAMASLEEQVAAAEARAAQLLDPTPADCCFIPSCHEDPKYCVTDDDGDVVVPYLWEELAPGMVLRVGLPVTSSGGDYGGNDVAPCKFPVGLRVITPAPIANLDPLEGRTGRGVDIITEVVSWSNPYIGSGSVAKRCISLVIDKWGIAATTGTLAPGGGCGGVGSQVAGTGGGTSDLCDASQQTVVASANGRYWRWISSNLHASTSMTYSTSLSKTEIDSKSASCGGDIWILYLPTLCGLRLWDSKTTSVDDEIFYSQTAAFSKRTWCASWAACTISFAIGMNRFTNIDTEVRASLDGTATCTVSVWDQKGNSRVDTALYRWKPKCTGGDLV